MDGLADDEDDDSAVMMDAWRDRCEGDERGRSTLIRLEKETEGSVHRLPNRDKLKSIFFL
jgi:hypothetical protein